MEGRREGREGGKRRGKKESETKERKEGWGRKKKISRKRESGEN